jgi:drug/metabolite transporter (DMT)-like permease
MPAPALILVLLSGVAHVGWNFLMTRADDHEAFVWWMQVVMAVLFAPLALLLFVAEPVSPQGWLFVFGTSLIHAFYFLFLARGYASGELSQVYPIARGTGPALVPILGVLLLGETVSLPAVAGIAAIVAGVFFVYWTGRMAQLISHPLQFLKEPGTRYAIATGLCIAAYSIWDKLAVSSVAPFLYMHMMAAGTGILLAPYILRRRGITALRAAWRAGARVIIAAAVLTFLAYGLVLSALQLAQVSYVWPAREIGIVLAVLLGSLVLKEPSGRGRLLGSCLIVLGIGTIAIAP